MRAKKMARRPREGGNSQIDIDIPLPILVAVTVKVALFAGIDWAWRLGPTVT